MLFKHSTISMKDEDVSKMCFWVIVLRIIWLKVSPGLKNLDYLHEKKDYNDTLT